MKACDGEPGEGFALSLGLVQDVAADVHDAAGAQQHRLHYLSTKLNFSFIFCFFVYFILYISFCHLYVI